MAILTAVNQSTLSLLTTPPQAGTGVHIWLARIAARLCRQFERDSVYRIMRTACDRLVTRTVRDQEINDAIALIERNPAGEIKRERWPQKSAAAVARVVQSVAPMIDPYCESVATSGEVIRSLFVETDLICYGPDTKRAVIEPAVNVYPFACVHQFVVPNPMKGLKGKTITGGDSARCKDNILMRRYLIVEIDDPAIDREQQCAVLTALHNAHPATPLVLAVDSGGKSVHGWFLVAHARDSEIRRLFAAACVLGADPVLWNPAQWVRMPGGTRKRDDGNKVQKILYWDGSKYE